MRNPVPPIYAVIVRPSANAEGRGLSGRDEGSFGKVFHDAENRIAMRKIATPTPASAVAPATPASAHSRDTVSARTTPDHRPSHRRAYRRESQADTLARYYTRSLYRGKMTLWERRPDAAETALDTQLCLILLNSPIEVMTLAELAGLPSGDYLLVVVTNVAPATIARTTTHRPLIILAYDGVPRWAGSYW